MVARKLALVAILASLALLILRIVLVGTFAFRNLAWNLFLAALPLLFASMIVNRRRRPLAALALGGLWLLFFPNAPYLVTDLIYLRARPPVPVWYDAMLLISFAITGLYLGWLSLDLMERLVSSWLGPRLGSLFRNCSILLAAVGVYVGRFLRWNSWDVLVQPGALMTDLWVHISQPDLLRRMLFVSAMFAMLILFTHRLWGSWRVVREEV